MFRSEKAPKVDNPEEVRAHIKAFKKNLDLLQKTDMLLPAGCVMGYGTLFSILRLAPIDTIVFGVSLVLLIPSMYRGYHERPELSRDMQASLHELVEVYRAAAGKGVDIIKDPVFCEILDAIRGLVPVELVKPWDAKIECGPETERYCQLMAQSYGVEFFNMLPARGWYDFWSNPEPTKMEMPKADEQGFVEGLRSSVATNANRFLYSYAAPKEEAQGSFIEGAKSFLLSKATQ